MEIPRHLQDLVDRLGHALVQALANDPVSRELAKDIQLEGFDIGLMLEATVALRRREDVLDPDADPLGMGLSAGATARENADFSEEDKALLRTFKISFE